jgi:hypothetical protein
VGKGGLRSCSHFLHKTCADICPRQMGCPLCREMYEEAFEVPPLSSPVEWFETMDMNRNGRLEMKEVTRAVAATLPVDVDVLEQVLPELWLTWGKTPQDSLSFKELLGPQGLLWQLQESSQQSGPRILHVSSETSPEFQSNKFGWFTHWDVDGSGVLDREEVVRGLTKQFHSDLSRDVCSKKLRMRQVVEELWPKVDLDANGKITLHEFVKDDGLADLILRQFKAKRTKSPVGTTSPRRSSKGQSSPRVKRLSRRSAARHQSLPADTSGSPQLVRSDRDLCRRATCPGMQTDLPDAGEDDRPMLLNRLALGFSPKAACGVGRETIAQWADAQDDLANWAASPGRRSVRGQDCHPRQELASLYGQPSPRNSTNRGQPRSESRGQPSPRGRRSYKRRTADGSLPSPPRMRSESAGRPSPGRLGLASRGDPFQTSPV